MNKTVRQIILPLITSIIWGAAFLFQGNIAEILPPFFINCIRSLIAFVALLFVDLGFSLYRKNKKLSVEHVDKKKLIIGGLCCGATLFIAVNLQQQGISQTTSAEAAFITTMYMVFVPLIGSFFSRKTGLNIWVAIIIAFIGLACICEFYNFDFNSGYLYLIVSAIFFALQILLVDYFVNYVDGVKLSALQFGVTSGLSGIASLIFEEVAFVNVGTWVMPFIFLGVFSSAGGYTLQIISQKGTNPALVSLLLSLESAFALIIEIIVCLISGATLNYSFVQYLGCALMLVAVVISQITSFNNAKKTSADDENDNNI